MTADWLIAGGGVGGLTLALTLARQGVPFRVFEGETSGREAGAELLLAPNATGILRRLVILEEAVKAGHATTTWRIQEHSGALLREIQVAAEELPALSIHRAKLIASGCFVDASGGLLSAVLGICIGASLRGGEFVLGGADVLYLHVDIARPGASHAWVAGCAE